MPTPGWINVAANGQQQRVWQRSDSSVFPGIILVDANDNIIGYVTPGAGFTPASNGALPTLALPHVANGTGTYDPVQGNVEGTALASGARTGSTRSANLTNYNNKGVYVFLNVTAVPSVPGTGGLQVQICPGTALDGHQYGVVAPQPSALIQAVGGYAFLLYPHMTPGGITNAAYSLCGVVDAPLPRTWGVYVVHGDAQSYTYAVYYSLVP